MTAGALPFVLSAWFLLGQQGARLGAYAVPTLSPWWVLAGVAAAFLLAPAGPRVEGRRLGAEALALGLAFVLLSLLRQATLDPASDLAATIEGDGVVRMTRLRIPGRRDLRRLTGQRRNVRLRTSAILEIPEAGHYRFELYCDDFCEIELGPHRLEARGSSSVELELAPGVVPFALQYRQDGGPASLLVSWDRPDAVELLPIDYYLAAPGTPPRSRLPADVALAGMLIWWATFSVYLVRLSRSRAVLERRRFVPLAAAGLVVLAGGLLRVEAFLAHSSLATTDSRWALVHDTILPWTPPYGVFNPENAPEDPYRADVRSYLDRASDMTLSTFYSASFREPFYVALTEPFLTLAGGEIGILLQSLSFSIATLVLFGLVAARMYGDAWAAALLVPVALHEWLVLEAPTGYRMSAYAFFLLLVVAWTFLTSDRSSRAAIGGALSGLTCLVRLSALSAITPLFALRVFRAHRSERRRYAILYAAPIVAIVAPFLWSNYRAHGDALYSVSFHTEFWLRAEGLDPRSGPVSLTRYLTDSGRTWHVLKGTFLGLTALPLRTFWNGLRHFLLLDVAVVTLGLAGLLASLRSRPWLLVAYLGHLVPFAYIQNFPSGEMPRFVMPAFFFLVLAVPEGWSWLSELVSRREPGAPAADRVGNPTRRGGSA